MELTTGYIVGGLARGCMIAFIGFTIISLFLEIPYHSIYAIFLLFSYGVAFHEPNWNYWWVMGEKFDHMGAVTNFIITPMTFLSGTFYSIKDLPSQIYGIAQYNPFFQAIDGFRYGITGYADGNLLNSGLSLLILNILLYALSCYLFRIGYKLKS